MPELTVQCLSKLSSTDGASDQALPYLQQLRDWVAGYLTQPHAELGRAGPVCPFARPTLDHDLLWYAVVHGDSPPLPEVVARLRELTAKFGSLPPEQGPDSLLKAALIVFPDVRDTSFIDRVQQTLKPDFVAAGLMIGQFYSGCSEPGLWSSTFRPLQSPVPLIAIRHMVSSDFPFLNSSAEWIEAYLRRFAPTVPSPVRAALADSFSTDG